MASSRVLEREVQAQLSRVSTATPNNYCPHKYSLLILVGRTSLHRQTEDISRDIERGIRSWDVDLQSCNLNLYLQEFLPQHTASFKGAGQKCLRHCTKVLDTQVLISPSQEQACSEVFALLSRESAHKLLILAGLSVEENGDLLFHQGQFSPHHLKQILTEQFLGQESSTSTKIHLTLSCHNSGHWSKTLSGNSSLQSLLTLQINTPEVLPVMESLGEFTSLISGTISPISPFDLLPPPTTVGFLKLSRPCCYVFPAGRGDCAFFAVNGFTVLVDGGSDSQACFWKLVRHLDRVDAVLLTHVGTENLPGVISFLERKLAEKELSADVKEDFTKKLISPELGVVFFNAPTKLQVEQQPNVDKELKSSQQAATTLRLLEKLDIRAQSMSRPQGVQIKPLTLFQKMGVGQLDLYILSPSKTSQEFETFIQNWPDASSSGSKFPALPLTALASVTALLVWHPACPQEKVVRVLFPGITPQAKLLQGLEKLKGLHFLQKPSVTTGDMEKLGDEKKNKRTESVDSCRSQGKDGNKQAKERGIREETKDGPKEKGKLSNGVVARDADKTKAKETGVKHKAAALEKNTSKKGLGKDGKKDKPESKEENSRSGQVKKDSIPSKLKNETKTKVKKETKNDSKGGEKKTRKASGKEGNDDKKMSGKANSPASGSSKAITVPGLIFPETLDAARDHKQETQLEANPCGSKMSTPEDMTADFLQLQKEKEIEETADKEKQKKLESGNKNSLEGLSVELCDKNSQRSAEGAVGGSGVMEVKREDNGMQNKAGTGEKAGSDPEKEHQEEHGNGGRPAKIAGFPFPLDKLPKTDWESQQDTTPTEYTLLDGALRTTPPMQSSPENQAPHSPEEHTAEPVSPDSRPNSAGHTPYCLSPDDVWCNRTPLSRLQAQMNNQDSADAHEPNGSSRQNDGQPKNSSGNHKKSREKHLSFLPLSTCKEGFSDPSPSLTTTTTTHSMPAEVSSPQSTEVDESLSMSFEQGPTTVSQREGDDGGNLSNLVGIPLKKPPRSFGQSSDMGRSFTPSTLPFETSAHDVDLCLVSPCEFKHFKPPEFSSGVNEVCKGVVTSQVHANNNNHKDMSPSESNAPACTEDCPSTMADGVLDSDEDESCSEPSNSPRDLNTSRALPPDPPPAPLRDSPPLPPHPGTSMPVPLSDCDAPGKRAKATGKRGKQMPGVDAPQKPSSGKKSQSGSTKVTASSPRSLSSNTRSTPAKSSSSPGSKSTSTEEASVYVDLTYIPSGASSPTVTVDFFRCVRSSCYIISGNSPEREELMRHILDALLDGKAFWPDAMQVTVIPTFESVSMQEWYQQTLERQRELNISVLGSNSTVAMQDETFPACKIEF